MSYINATVVEDPESGKGIQHKAIEDINEVTTTDIHLDVIHSNDSPGNTIDPNHQMKKLRIDIKTLKLIGGVFIKVNRFRCSINSFNARILKARSYSHSMNGGSI